MPKSWGIVKGEEQDIELAAARGEPVIFDMGGEG